MAVWVDVMRLTAGVNVLLLVGLSAIWARNYRRFRSKHALGLVIFGLLLLAENSVAFYSYALHPELSTWLTSRHVPELPGMAMMAIRILQTAALLFLAWITWD
jgi:hypothetical protein